MTTTDDVRDEVIAVNAGIGRAVRALDAGDEAGVTAALADMQYHLDAAKTLAGQVPMPDQPLTLTQPGQFQARTGSGFSYRFVVSGGVPPYHFTWSNNPPAGLTLSESGYVSGTIEAAAGEFVGDVLVLDSAPQPHVASATFDMKVL